jgi:hypothetical protein
LQIWHRYASDRFQMSIASKTASSPGAGVMKQYISRIVSWLVRKRFPAF